MAGIAVSVFTNGRLAYLDETLRSFEENVRLGPGNHWRCIFDDSGDEDVVGALRARYGGGNPLWPYPDWDVIPNPKRLGFGGTIANAWRFLSVAAGDPSPLSPLFVFHLEDDFTFEQPVDLVPLQAILEFYPEIVQIAFRRQAWNDAEVLAGGVVELAPDSYREKHATLFVPEDAPVSVEWTSTDLPPRLDVSWLEHRLFFTTNPSLYRISLCQHGWPDGDQSEGAFAAELFGGAPAAVAAYWGRRGDPPLVRHIGRERLGFGY